MTARRLNFSAFAGTVLAVAVLSSPMTLASAQAHPVKHKTVQLRTHHKRARHPQIPQHNRGDHDPDNNGAPSDGDGNL
jgi:hypothetical protein